MDRFMRARVTKRGDLIADHKKILPNRPIKIMPARLGQTTSTCRALFGKYFGVMIDSLE